MNRLRNILGLGLIAGAVAVSAADVRADTPKAEASPAALGPDQAQLAQSRQAAINFLKTTQADEGYWTSPQAPGISALVLHALLLGGLPMDDPSVQRGLKHLESFVQDDGGIYFTKSSHRNYETAIALMTFDSANAAGRYDQVIANAEKFLRKLQWDEDEGIDPSDPRYGGAGYGSHERPDLSNTTFFMEALKAAGVKENDPAFQKALVFVSRSQNLETEHNVTPFASKVNDGGFYYTPAAGGTSQAGPTPDGGLRSYGSMTYAGLKSMIHAGLTPEDERVQAAYDWIRKFYTVEENPGLGQQGVYYYYQMFAKALDTLDLAHIEDAQGEKHDWRKELAEHLFQLQQPNGSWVNEATRWYEGDPNLATAYVLMALKYAEPTAVK